MKRKDDDTRTQDELDTHLRSASNHPKCRSCSHVRIMHSNRGKCEQVVKFHAQIFVVDVDTNYCSSHTLIEPVLNPAQS